MRLLQRRESQPGQDVRDQLGRAQDEASQLRAQLERVQGALDGLPIGVVLVGATGEVLSRNATASSLGGAPHGDVLIRAAVDRHAVRALAEEQDPETVQRLAQKMIGEAHRAANAIDDDPGRDVHLTVERIDQWIEFVVRDGGIGIPARDLDRIFERFYRVDRARSRETGGTGHAIVRHVVTNHQGEITVQSIEGEGSTFTMRIPAP